MARLSGVVTHAGHGRLDLEFDVKTAAGCQACAAGHGCQWRRNTAPRRLRLDARAGSCQLEPGATVAVEVDDRRLLAAAARLYLPPCVGLLTGPALLRLVGLEQGGLPLLAALAGLLAGLAVAARWTRHAVPVRCEPLAAAGDVQS